MYNLGTVIAFEVSRTLKKKSFWITALGFPVAMAVVALIIFFSNKASSDVSKDLENQKYSLAVTDQSDTITPKLLKTVNAKEITPGDKQATIDLVKKGSLDAYFYYPANLARGQVEVYAKDVGLFQNSRYQSLAQSLVEESVNHTVDPSLQAVLQGKLDFAQTTFTSDGQVDKGYLKLIAPGIFLILFYLIIAVFGNQILTSTTEEKENRVIEMLLTTVKSTTLIVGKILSLVTLVCIQTVVTLVPIIIGYLAFKDQLTLPSFDLSSIPFDPLRIAIAVVIFFASFLLFTGLLMAIGAATPTAKEASGYFGLIMVLIFGPLYAAPLFVTAPDSILVQVLSYFPFTAPIPLLLRNAVGNLTIPEAAISITLLVIATIFVIRLAVRIFRFGALEYSRRLNLKEIFARN